MGGVLDFFEDLISTIWDAIEAIWDEIVMPILEEVFSWFGIVDEYIVVSSRNCVPLYDYSDADAMDLYGRSVVDAVIKFTKDDISFIKHYLNEVYKLRGRIRASKNYFENTIGLSDQFIRANKVETTSLDAALVAEFGAGSYTITNVYSGIPLPQEYIKDSLQSTPYFYKDYFNTLTYDNVWGETFTDWNVDDIVFIDPTWDVEISRTAERAIFWIEGPDNVVEGETATYTIYCSETIPAGLPVDIDFAYTGTAVDATDYTSVASATMLAGTDSVEVDIVTLATGGDTGARSYNIAIDYIDNTNNAFEDVYALPGDDSVTTAIIDDDTFSITAPDYSVEENIGFLNITVTSHVGNGGTPFTVDWDTVGITAQENIDFTDASGTLNFDGTAGDTDSFVITIIDNDGSGENHETLKISFSNSSDAGCDITHEPIITIRDGEVAASGSTTTLQETISVANPTTEPSLVTRFYAGGIGNTQIWIYPYSAGTYGDIEPERRELSKLDLMPFFNLRFNGTPANSNPNLLSYRRKKYAMRLLGLNIDDLIDQVNESPYISDVQHATLVFAMAPADSNPILSKLLYLHWHWIVEDQSLISNMGSYSAVTQLGNNNANGTIDAVLGWNNHGISKDQVGNVVVDGSGNAIIDGYVHGRSGNVLQLWHQKADNLYDYIFVDNLHCSSGTYVNTGGTEEYWVAPSELSQAEFSQLVSTYMLDQLTIEELLEVYPYILRLDVFALTEVEIAWYKTSAFLDLVKIVVVIVTIVTAGAAGGILALIETIAVNYLVGELILVVATFIAQETGNEDLALAIAALAYAAVATGGSFNFSMLDAQALTNLVTDFADTFSALEALETQSVQEDLERLQEEYEARADAINEANEANIGNDISSLASYLTSPSTSHMLAIASQYNFDEIFNYDTLVANFHSNQLRTGVV